MSDYYNILGVEKNASDNEIKQAYRQLAKQYHPDKGGDKEKFQKIQEAYDTLSDSTKRQQYDNPMPDFANIFGGGGGGPPDFADLFGGGGGFPFGGFNFGNMFQRGGGSRKKSNIQKVINVNLEDIFKGTEIKFKLLRNIICKTCNKNCTKCKGTGKENKQVRMGPMIQIITSECQQCNGTGMQKATTCSVCNSVGSKEDSKIILLKIPKGTDNGFQYVYEGWGEQPIKEGEIAGNLILIVNINTHNFFERSGLNLKSKIQLSFKESIIGKKITIPYFDEPFEFDTKDHCGIIDPNKEYVITKKGLENDKKEKGNLYINFVIKYPNYKILKNNDISQINELFTRLNID